MVSGLLVRYIAPLIMGIGNGGNMEATSRAGGFDIRGFIAGLRSARGPLCSLLLGFLLFGSTPQVHDLFIEPQSTAFERISYWLLFYIAVIIFWVLPIYLASFLTVRDQPDLPESARFAPFALAVLALLVVAFGVYSARQHLASNTLIPAGGVPKVFWSLINVHVSPLTVEAGQFLQYFLILSLVVVAAGVAIAVVPRSRSWLTADIRRVRGGYGAIALLCALSFLSYQIPTVRQAFWGSLPRSILLLILLGLFSICVDQLARLGRKTGHPFTLYALALLALVGLVRENRYDIRLSDAREIKPSSRLSFADAVNAWMRENNCLEGSAICPQPIIVAASGGASRAAYFTGSVLASLEEASRNKKDGRAFSKQLFAISSVSGSSLAAAGYVGALQSGWQSRSKEDPCKAESNWFQCHSSFKLNPRLIAMRFAARLGPWEYRGFKDRLQVFTSGDFRGGWADPQ